MQFSLYELKMTLTVFPDYYKVRRLFQTEARWRTPSWRGTVEEPGVKYPELLGGVR